MTEETDDRTSGTVLTEQPSGTAYRMTEDETVTEAVVAAVAAVTDRDPTALPPLYGTVDPEALDALVGPADDDQSTAGVQVGFEYAGTDVTAASSGRIFVAV